MSKPLLESVYARFLIYLIPPVVILFLALFVAFEYVEYGNAMAELSDEISTEIATSSLLIAEATYHRNIRDIRLTLAATLANPNISGITVFDRDGEILDAFGIAPEDPDCMKKQIGINFTEGDTIMKVGELCACYHDTHLIADFYQHTVYLTLLTLLFISVAIGSAFIAYRSTVGIPLTRLYERILARVQDGKHEPVEWQSNDEIGRVISEYNRMQAIISEQEEAMSLDKSSLEEELNQVHKMEAVGRLAGGIAHDFNNLLTAIIGYTDIARRKGGADADADLAQVMETSKRAAALTDQLLTFSRKQFVNPSLLNLNAVVQNTHQMLSRIIRADIVITTKLEEISPIEIDKSQLTQILLNLAINASDAMPGGGEISISTGPFEKTTDYPETHPKVPPGCYTLLKFADTGQGIETKDLGSIFEPFYTTKDKDESVGLGLSTVYGIVKQSGGHIYVDSEVNHGTVFSIYFPAREGQAEIIPITDASVPASIRTGGTIIVAEDDIHVQSLIHEVLKNGGYDVQVASTGEKAMHLASQCQQPIALLVTDIIMPGMSGKELAMRLMKSCPNIKVLYISGHIEVKTGKESKPEFDDFLRKPFSPDELMQAVDAIIGSVAA